MCIKVVPMKVQEVQWRTDRTASGSSEDVGSVFPEAVDRRESLYMSRRPQDNGVLLQPVLVIYKNPWHIR